MSFYDSSKVLINRIPDHMLPVADCSKNEILISLDRKTFGKVYVWHTVEPDASDGRNIYLVADSFSEYLANLRRSPERDGPTESVPVFSDVELGNWRAVEKYLTNRGNPNAVSDAGNTLLTLAAKAPWPRIVKLLLDHGADVHKTDRMGMTALHYAAEKSSFDSMRLLLDSGADCLKQNVCGQTALQYRDQLYGDGGSVYRARALLMERTQRAKRVTALGNNSE